MNKRTVATISSLLTFAVLAIVLAVPSNWYEAADVTGVVIQSESGTIKAAVNLGMIPSGSGFSVSGNGTIIIQEAEGLNITKVLFGPDSWSYFQDRFYFLAVNVTIDGNTWPPAPLIIVKNGKFNADDMWIGTAYGYSYYSVGGNYYLPQGNHTMIFDVYGRTQLVSANLTVSFQFRLELSL